MYTRACEGEGHGGIYLNTFVCVCVCVFDCMHVCLRLCACFYVLLHVQVHVCSRTFSFISKQVRSYFHALL